MTNQKNSGIPKFEKVALHVGFKAYTAFCSPKSALKAFNREVDLLLRIANEEDESYDVFQSLDLPRLIGIERSSNHWSIAMVLEHLCMTNRDMLKVIQALLEGVAPRGEVDTALYKPDPDVGDDVFSRYQSLAKEYSHSVESLISSRGSLNSAVRYAHPWFGEIDAHQWNCLCAIHQRLHRRQAQKIVAMLGVT